MGRRINSLSTGYSAPQHPTHSATRLSPLQVVSLAAFSLFTLSCGSGDQGVTVSSDEAVLGDGSLAKEIVGDAIASTRQSSYAFSQELGLSSNLLGERSTLASGEPIASGFSSGEDLTITTHLGPLLREVALAEGATEGDLEAPFVADMTSIETGLWVVGDEVTIDVSQFVDVFGLALFQTTDDRGPQASSPVSINRPQLQALGPDGDETASRRFIAWGHGEMVTNPVEMLAVLEELSQTTDPATVSGVVNGEESATYRFQVPYIEYATALNQDVASRLERAGINLRFNSRDWPEQMDQAIREANVEVSVTIDGEGLLRQLTTEIDLGTFAKYWSSHDLDVLENDTFEIMEMTVTTFEQHGESFTISAPDAVDVTRDLVLHR